MRIYLWMCAALIVASGMALALTPIEAQQRPYVGYNIPGGCLYITPQGHAVIREWYVSYAGKC